MSSTDDLYRRKCAERERADKKKYVAKYNELVDILDEMRRRIAKSASKGKAKNAHMIKPSGKEIPAWRLVPNVYGFKEVTDVYSIYILTDGRLVKARTTNSPTRTIELGPLEICRVKDIDKGEVELHQLKELCSSIYERADTFNISLKRGWFETINDS